MNPNEHIKKTKPCFRFAYGVSKERLSCFLDILNQNRIRHRLRSKPIHVADIDFQTGNITFTDEYQQLWTIYIYEEDLQKVISHTQHLERYSNEEISCSFIKSLLAVLLKRKSFLKYFYGCRNGNT